MINMLKNPAVPLLILACLVFWHFSQKDIAATGIQWKCNSHDCRVSFDLENRSKDLLYKTLQIKAIQRTYHGKSRGMSRRVMGETICPVEILPQSTQRLNRAVVLAHPGDVNLIAIKALNRRN